MTLKVTDAEIRSAIRTVAVSGARVTRERVRAIVGGGSKDRIMNLIREAGQETKLPGLLDGHRPPVDMSVAVEGRGQEGHSEDGSRPAGSAEVRTPPRKDGAASDFSALEPPAQAPVAQVSTLCHENNQAAQIAALEAQVAVLTEALATERALRRQETEAYARLLEKTTGLLRAMSERPAADSGLAEGKPRAKASDVGTPK